MPTNENRLQKSIEENYDIPSSTVEKWMDDGYLTLEEAKYFNEGDKRHICTFDIASKIFGGVAIGLAPHVVFQTTSTVKHVLESDYPAAAEDVPDISAVFVLAAGLISSYMSKSAKDNRQKFHDFMQLKFASNDPS